ncbi:MAG TPA: hypothetical protein DCE71_04805 [Parachlamydiales bacterium]|nr:hypothetical protein [Parachlamydiales bacterium]
MSMEKKHATPIFKKAVKRPMILFEIVVGLALLSMLLSLLFSFFTSSAKMQDKLKKAEAALEERQHLSSRLQTILTSVIPSSDPYLPAPLYTQQFPEEKNISLVVYFDHGIDPDPAFSGPSLARIYINPKHELCLAIWPREREKGKTSVRHEVLLRHVESFAFQFATKKADQSIGWENKRPAKAKQTIPSLVRLDIWENEQKKPSLQFAFALSSTEPSIVYSAHEGVKKKI